MSLVTAKVGGSNPTLELSQQRFLPRGSQGSSHQTWNIPVCVRYPVGSDTLRACTLMTSPSASLDLAKSKGCPTWTYANAEQTGYYVALYQREMLDSLLNHEKTLSLVERVGLIGDIRLPSGESTR